jgi:hypothetical protein
MIRAQIGAPCAVPQRRTREAWQPCQEDLGRLRTRQPLPVPALLKAETQFNNLNQACVSVRPHRSDCIFSGMQLSLAGTPTNSITADRGVIRGADTSRRSKPQQARTPPPVSGVLELRIGNRGTCIGWRRQTRAAAHTCQAAAVCTRRMV